MTKITLALAAFLTLLIEGQARAITNPDPDSQPVAMSEEKCFATRNGNLTVCQLPFAPGAPKCFATRSPGAVLTLCQGDTAKSADVLFQRCVQQRSEALQRYDSLDIIVSLHVAERNCERAWGAILWLQDGAPKY